MTERLYEKDSYCREFEARVESCVSDNGFFNVVLDKTAFFPEGGGQAADSGFIGDVKVLDVQIENGIISHKTETPLSQGETVSCSIDWDLRFSRMQSHSAEHIVSGLVHSKFGYDNVGFHMSESAMTVDFSGPLNSEDINLIELLSNKAVYENLSVTAVCPSNEELEGYSYRSKIDIKDGTRLVIIGDVDCCACCAPHVARTGEIGLIKTLDFMPHRGGTRIEMVAGIHAYNDYFAISASNKALMKMLSASRYAVAEAVEKQSEGIQLLKSENMKMSRKIALLELQPVNPGNFVYAVTEGIGYDDLRYCANSLLQEETDFCCLFSKTEDGNCLYVVSSKTGDVRELVKNLNEVFDGKGGGKPDYAQGRISNFDEERLKQFLASSLK